jgi:hypothetical protein
VSDLRRRLLRDQATRLDKSSLSVTNECLRFRFEESADLLALMASKGEFVYDELLTVVREVLSGARTPESAADLDPYALSALTRLMAGLHMGERLMTGDFGEAADFSQVARLLKADVEFGYYAARVEGQVNLATGRFDHVDEMLAAEDLNHDTARMLRLELAHPANGRPGATIEGWLAECNRVLGEFDLLPVTLAPDDGVTSAFDRVRVEVPVDRLITDGPLITVVMSTFQPDQSFRTAVRSVLAQTWQNLELLIVDDCSPPEFDALLAEVAGADQRIDLIRMPVNGGTYRIRNEAIRRSRGSFIAFHDSDDWAHPERLARQIAPLLAPPSSGSHRLLATHCRGLRVFPTLSSLNVGLNSFRRSEASTLFAKDAVIDVLGGFDETRKSADNEFYERIGVVFGQESILNLPDVLVLTQLTQDSLSRDELRFAWQHGARTGYVQARRHWHRQILAGRESPRLEPGAVRQIPAPHRIVTGRDPEPEQCDVLFISDWRVDLTRTIGQAGFVEASTAAGYTTLLAQATTVRHAHRDRMDLCDDVLGLEAAGRTRFVVWTDDTRARLAVVLDPEILNLTRPPDSVGIRADRLVIVAPHPPQAPDGGWLTYAPAVVDENAERMFGSTPDWLPATAEIAEALRAGGARSVLDPGQFLSAPRPHRRPYRGSRGSEGLVVGTGGLEPRRRDWPDRSDLLARLPTSAEADVRIHQDSAVSNRIARWRARPPAWLVIDEEMAFGRFLRSLDVHVVMPTRTWGPAVHWTALAAMSEGAVVVADPDMEPFLGEAALYSGPGGAADALKALAADAEEIDRQRERGYAFCESRASSAEVAALIGRLIPGGKDAQ